jgi:hypothetical protein
MANERRQLYDDKEEILVVRNTTTTGNKGQLGKLKNAR